MEKWESLDQFLRVWKDRKRVYRKLLRCMNVLLPVLARELWSELSGLIKLDSISKMQSDRRETLSGKGWRESCHFYNSWTFTKPFYHSKGDRSNPLGVGGFVAGLNIRIRPLSVRWNTCVFKTSSWIHHAAVLSLSMFRRKEISLFSVLQRKQQVLSFSLAQTWSICWFGSS